MYIGHRSLAFAAQPFKSLAFAAQPFKLCGIYLHVICYNPILILSLSDIADKTRQTSHTSRKMTVLGELCCVALPLFFCVVVVALPFSASDCSCTILGLRFGT